VQLAAGHGLNTFKVFNWFGNRKTGERTEMSQKYVRKTSAVRGERVTRKNKKDKNNEKGA
jgi:hypothetical protein